MGYQTVKKVRSCRNYELAKLTHDSITPIRGNPNNVRPLGNRRDWETYSVRMNGEAVEFVLYKTPVVTFQPDGIIEVRSGGWDSISTRQFISQVLYINCYGRRGKTVVDVENLPVVLAKDGVIRLRVDDGRVVLAQERPVIYGFKLNRAAANNVRARYKEFYTYLKGFINLRSGVVKGKWGGEMEGVSFTTQEAADVLGVKNRGSSNPIVFKEQFERINRRPSEEHPHWRKHNKLDEVYPVRCKKFFELISSGDHMQFYEATMGLLTFDIGTIWADEGHMSHVFSVEATKPLTLLDSIVMRWHADEVLERVALTDGNLPNPKYENWFDKE